MLDLAAQVYGILATPNMKDINDRNLSFWSPHPLFIGVFFFSLQVFQVAWLYRLLKLNGSKPKERVDLDEMVDFVPFFCAANLSLGIWMIFWNAEQLKTSDVFVFVEALVMLYYMLVKLQPLDPRSGTSILNNLVCRAYAGIGILDIVHNTSIAYFKDVPATISVKVVTGIFFGFLTLVSDWIFGATLVYDLFAIAANQDGSWRVLLAAYGVIAAAIVGIKNIAR